MELMIYLVVRVMTSFLVVMDMTRLQVEVEMIRFGVVLEEIYLFGRQVMTLLKTFDYQRMIVLVCTLGWTTTCISKLMDWTCSRLWVLPRFGELI